MTREEQMYEIVGMIRSLGKVGIVYQNNVNKIWRGFGFYDPTDYWVEKGDLDSAHIRLNACNDSLIKLIFSINGEYMPSAKHRISILKKLDWVPDELWMSFESIYCYPDFSEETFQNRVKKGAPIIFGTPLFFHLFCSMFGLNPIISREVYNA